MFVPLTCSCTLHGRQFGSRLCSRTRNYDAPSWTTRLRKLDLGMAQDPESHGIDVELRLFLAAAPEQVAAWARGWEPFTDA